MLAEEACDGGGFAEVRALEYESCVVDAAERAERVDRFGMSSDEVVDDDDGSPVVEQPLDGVRADVPGAAGDENGVAHGRVSLGARVSGPAGVNRGGVTQNVAAEKG